MRKITLPSRVTPELIVRLDRMSKAKKLDVNDTISCALDALEREEREGYSMPERVTYLEKNVNAFFELVMTFTEKLEAQFSHANLYEKERLKSLYQLIKELSERSDRAQEERTLRILQAISAQETRHN